MPCSKAILRSSWRRCCTSGTGWRKRATCCTRSCTDAAAWQQLDLLAWGYTELLQVALARGDGSLRRTRAARGGTVGAARALWDLPRLAANDAGALVAGAGTAREASDWAAGVVFPEGPWEGTLYDAFPVVIRVYFAQQSFQEALELLERWRGHLDRPANMQDHHHVSGPVAGGAAPGRQASNRPARIAARLFALTEPEGYLRVYLDEGEPMRQALLALLTPHSRQQELAPSTRAYISKLLAAFEQEKQDASRSTCMAATYSEPAPSPARQASAISSVPAVSLTRREQEVLRLLAAGASNQDIAQTLVISLATVKKHVSNLLGKLGATSRTQALARRVPSRCSKPDSSPTGLSSSYKTTLFVHF